MNKTVLVSLSIVAATTVICFSLYIQNNRFVSVNAGNGKVYKIDKKTGKTVVIVSGQEYPVAGVMTPEERAIEMAKDAVTLWLHGAPYVRDNKEAIINMLREETGNLNVIGWQAQRIDDQTILVTHSHSTDYGKLYYVFEVNLRAGIVRNVNGNMELLNKYKIPEGRQSSAYAKPDSTRSRTIPPIWR